LQADACHDNLKLCGRWSDWLDAAVSSGQGGIRPVTVEGAFVCATEMMIWTGGDVKQICPDGTPLCGRQQRKRAIGEAAWISEMENHVVPVKTPQLGDEIRGKMEAHPLGVEKTETAVATVQLQGWDTTPVFCLVAGAVTSARSRIVVIVYSDFPRD
jgi:hypothetical protein